MLLTGCSTTGSEQATEQAQESKKTLEPVLIGEWTGVGNKTTQSFAISGNQWAISWAFSPKAPIYGIYANFFSIQVYDLGTDFPIELVANIANTSSSKSDISYIHSSGNFYLTISSLEGSWAIKVFDYK